MNAFRTAARSACASHEALALALAAELGCDTAGAPEAVRALAGELPRAAEPVAGSAAMLAAVARLCTGTFGGHAPDVLLLPEVLRRGGGDPAGVAVAAVVVAQQAAYPVGLVGCRDRLLIAHHFSDEPFVVDPAAGLIDARTLGFDLHWRCAHESAAVILGAASERAERRGELVTAIAAEALALALPLEERSRAAREAAHRRLLARRN